MDDRALLRDLRAAVEATEGQDPAARNDAVEAVLRRHDASLDDVARLLRRARQQHRSELRGLSVRLGGLIAQREETESTIDAVEAFLRGHSP